MKNAVVIDVVGDGKRLVAVKVRVPDAVEIGWAITVPVEASGVVVDWATESFWWAERCFPPTSVEETKHGTIWRYDPTIFTGAAIRVAGESWARVLSNPQHASHQLGIQYSQSFFGRAEAALNEGG